MPAAGAEAVAARLALAERLGGGMKVELVEIKRVHRVPPGSVVLCRHGQSPS
jgi:hypothetical protein